MKKLVAVSRCSSVHHGCCPVRAAGRLPGAGHGVRGENPLYTPCTPVLPFAREREICLLSWAVPRPPRAAWGIGANLPRPVAGVMPAPAAALRPPFGRPGSPPRPQHAASAARDGRGDLAGRSGGGKLADRRAVFLSFVGSYNDFLWPLVVLSDDRKYTLTLGLNRLQGTFYTDPRLVAAGAIISLVPIVIFFALFQKNLFLGLQEGGLKG